MEELLKFCRYYKGEGDSPFKDQNKSMLWFYERVWVLDMLNNRLEGSLISEYIYAGLGDFADNDGVPMSYKAYLFNRYAQGCNSMMDAVEPFKNFYTKYYGK